MKNADIESPCWRERTTPNTPGTMGLRMCWVSLGTWDFQASMPRLSVPSAACGFERDAFNPTYKNPSNPLNPPYQGTLRGNTSTLNIYQTYVNYLTCKLPCGSTSGVKLRTPTKIQCVRIFSICLFRWNGYRT